MLALRGGAVPEGVSRWEGKERKVAQSSHLFISLHCSLLLLAPRHPLCQQLLQPRHKEHAWCAHVYGVRPAPDTAGGRAYLGP